jgi:hypothetical protein
MATDGAAVNSSQLSPSPESGRGQSYGKCSSPRRSVSACNRCPPIVVK